MLGAEVAVVSCVFDIFEHRVVHAAALGILETVYKHVASVEQNDLEFMIPGDSDTYIDLNINLSVRGKLVSSSGQNVDVTDTTAVANNLSHSLFS